MSLSCYLAYTMGDPRLELPLQDEPMASSWCAYQQRANTIGLYALLKQKLITINFPVQTGISGSDAYKLAQHRGVAPAESWELLQAPTRLKLTTYQSLGGRIPILSTTHRPDFEALVRALARKNEPVLLPKSMNACFVSGIINWDRVNHFRTQWENNMQDSWQNAFTQFQKDKGNYLDRLILLNRAEYSGVSAEILDLSNEEWLDLSSKIRLEHECAHYFTKRMFGTIRKHLLDELVADYAGMIGAINHFRSDWFLHFMGLEAYPAYRSGGRLENYIPDELHNQTDFPQIAAYLFKASQTLETFDQTIAIHHRELQSTQHILMAVATMSLVQLAEPDACQELAQRFFSHHTGHRQVNELTI